MSGILAGMALCAVPAAFGFAAGWGARGDVEGRRRETREIRADFDRAMERSKRSLARSKRTLARVKARRTR